MLIGDFRYRPEIDGLRAIAVAAVVLYHAGFGFPGGYVGVDVFFVISGYLITSLIVRDLESGRFSMAGFWQRRIRRILPAMAVVVVAVLMAGWFLMLPADYARLAESAFWQTLLASNVYFWLETGYFAPKAEEQPLLHTWSLAVEEQFYLVVPVVLALVFTVRAWRQRRVLLSALAFVTIISFAWSVCGVSRYPSAAFYLLPTRAWELSLGSFVALLPTSSVPGPVVRNIAAVAGLAMIAASYFLYSKETPFPGWAAALPCAGTALVIWSTHAGAVAVRQFLSLRPAVFIGTISYSLYLWHWPLLAFATYLAFEPLSMMTRAGLVLLSVALAALSWRFVEQPFRRRTLLPRGTQMFPLLGGTSAVILFFAASVWQTGGAPWRLPSNVLSQAVAVDSPDFSFNPGPKDVEAGRLRRLGALREKDDVDVVVWGDSHAMVMAKAFDSLLKERNASGVLAARLSSAPVFDAWWRGNGQPLPENRKCPAFNEAVFDFILEKDVRNVVLACNWEIYKQEDGTRPIGDALLDTVKRVKSEGINVYVLLQIPNQGFDVPKVLGLAAITGRDTTHLLAEATDHRPLGDAGIELAQELKDAGAVLIDPSRVLLDADNRRFIAAKDGQTLFFDGTHLTPRAAEELLLPLLRESIVPAATDSNHDS
jgi:peptidoglycan/LPS O-acetylase OafA/YrhL